MAKTVFTDTQIINQIDSGAHWSGTAWTFGFISSASWISGSEKDGFFAYNADQRAAATRAISLWDDLIIPKFTQTSDYAGSGTKPNIAYGNSSAPSYAYAYYPGSYSMAGTVWTDAGAYGDSSGTNNLLHPVVGKWGFMTYIHETGHALGLDHPGAYNGGSPTYETNAEYMQDTQMYTIMSYFSASKTGADWVASDGNSYYCQTPMIDDVMTIQAIYGADTTTRATGTTYGFNSTLTGTVFDFSSNRHPVLCIYDAGGTDTLDLSGFSTASRIDLTPGTFSDCDAMTYNVSIARNTWVENAVGGSGSDNIKGNSQTNLLTGGAGDDTITGGAGVDTLVGGTGNDTYVFNLGDGLDTVREFVGEGTLDQVKFGTGILASNITVTKVANGGGTDVVLAHSNGVDRITLSNWTIGGNNGIERVVFADGTTWTAADISAKLTTNVTLTGDAGNNSLGGGAGNDSLFGLGGNDVLSGYAGNDLLDGGTGNDTMIGGIGDDTYVVDSTLDVVTELAGEGTDQVQSSVTLTALATNVENLLLTGTAAINGTGNSLNNTLTGNSAANILNGGAGNDRMVGGQGDDRYIVDSTGDTVVELANEGFDWVESSVTFSLVGTGADGLILTGTAAINGTGNELDNSITGNAANNILSGGAGGDTLDGGAGNDTLNGDAGNDVLIGMAGSDTLSGGDGNDEIDGGEGADAMLGGTGNDMYFVDNTGDVVTEAANAGTDQVLSSVTFSLGANLEMLGLIGTAAINGTGNELANTLGGNSAANVLTGGAGNDQLRGNGGNDTLIGGTGDDIYWFRTGDGVDTVREVAGEGTADEIRFDAGIVATDISVSLVTNGSATDLVLAHRNGTDRITLSNWSRTGTNGIERVVFSNGTTWTAADLNAKISPDVTLTGTTGNDTLTGSVGNDKLYGQAGNDTLNGGAGNDLLDGGEGNDYLDGGTGNDTMAGGNGNDNYIVDSSLDVVTENAGAGTDIVAASVTYTLTDNVEALILTGTAAINGTGNTLNNVLIGNAAGNSLYGGAGNDQLDGALGADQMFGGQGNDIYTVENTLDSVNENAGEGTDIVYSSVSYTLKSNVEYLFLTGSASITGTGNELNNIVAGNGANNILYGGLGNDLIDGGSGADRMEGGLGDDTFVVDNTADTVVEGTSAGTDTVQSSVTYTLAANVEKLTLTGSAAINGTGNTLNNVLYGNSANNILDGSIGADIMLGGAGNDTYVVDNAGDVASEAPDAGTDTVLAAVSYALGSNLENLTLTGAATINATGNTLANTLVGNNSNNVLDGGVGNDVLYGQNGVDTLIGGTGNDMLYGGSGADTYKVRRGDGADGISEYDTAAGVRDILAFDASAGAIANNQLWFRRVGNNLEISVIGTADKVSVSNWYLGSAYHVENITAGGKTLVDTKVDALVNAMASMTPPPLGQTTLSAAYSTKLAPVIAANWV